MKDDVIKGHSTYRVLRETMDDGGWQSIAVINATSAAAAIKEAVQLPDQGGAGTYVAVPARSWKPVTVKIETKQQVTFG